MNDKFDTAMVWFICSLCLAYVISNRGENMQACSFAGGMGLTAIVAWVKGLRA